MSQFIECKFRSNDTRTYTYVNNGEPVAAGDFVKVPDNRSDVWKRVQVVTIDVPEPSYARKPILGRVDDEPAGAGLI